MAKPKYIADLENRMESIEGSQQTILDQTKEIHIALLGTEYDQAEGGKGGIVQRLGDNEDKVEGLNKWKTQSKARNAVIWIGVSSGLAALWAFVVRNS